MTTGREPDFERTLYRGESDMRWQIRWRFIAAALFVATTVLMFVDIAQHEAAGTKPSLPSLIAWLYERTGSKWAASGLFTIPALELARQGGILRRRMRRRSI